MDTTSQDAADDFSLSVTLGAMALASYAGPALVAHADGSVAAANDAACTLRAVLDGGEAGDIAGSVARAAGSGQSCTEVVVLSTAMGHQILDLTLLPVTSGMVLILAKDITLDRNLRSALIESRHRYKDLVEISSDFAWEVGADGCFTFVSPKGVLGHRPDHLIGRAPADFIIEQAGSEGAPVFRAIEPVEDVEVWMRRADGLHACLRASAAPLLDRDGVWRGARGVCRDITNERARDAALVRANNRERLLTYIVRTIRDVVDPADMLTAAAQATARAMGANGCQIFRMDMDSGDFGLAATHGAVGEARGVLDSFMSGDFFEGAVGPWQALATVTRYRHAINGALCLWRDGERLAWNDDDRLLIDDVANQIGIANEQILNHERILRLSRTDGLTGLFNRRAFFEELGRRFSRLSREGRAAALIYVDLDNFKSVNDVHGHQMGDEALLAVRDLLINNTRPIDLVARLGGDEFAVWLDGADEAAALNRGKLLLQAGCELARYSGHPDLPLGMSLGVAVHEPARAESLQDLLNRADEAMYEVKRDGKGALRLARPAAAGAAAEREGAS